jgi:hypothetical protein
LKARSKDGPHADAAYRVIRRSDEAFGVEVTIPESYPTTFASAADAEAWVAALKQRVAGTPVVRLLAEEADKHDQVGANPRLPFSISRASWRPCRLMQLKGVCENRGRFPVFT